MRLTIARGAERTLVDLGWDTRDWPVATNPSIPGPVLAFEELAASKVLALDARAEPRDFVDVYHLARQIGTTRLLELAKHKDAGFSVTYFREALARFPRHKRVDFPIDDSGYRDLATFVKAWATELEPPERPPPSRQL